MDKLVYYASLATSFVMGILATYGLGLSFNDIANYKQLIAQGLLPIIGAVALAFASGLLLYVFVINALRSNKKYQNHKKTELRMKASNVK